MPERDVERRITELEAHVNVLLTKISGLWIEYEHIRNTLESRFQALDKGQDRCLEQIDLLRNEVRSMAGDVSLSPAGRAVMKEIDGLIQRVSRYDVQLAEIAAAANELRGAIRFARMIGVSSLSTIIVTLALVIARILGIVP